MECIKIQVCACSMAENQRRKKWADKAMVMAMDAVRNEKMSIYSSVVKFSVSHKTLDD